MIGNVKKKYIKRLRITAVKEAFKTDENQVVEMPDGMIRIIYDFSGIAAQVDPASIRKVPEGGVEFETEYLAQNEPKPAKKEAEMIYFIDMHGVHDPTVGTAVAYVELRKPT